MILYEVKDHEVFLYDVYEKPLVKSRLTLDNQGLYMFEYDGEWHYLFENARLSDFRNVVEMSLRHEFEHTEFHRDDDYNYVEILEDSYRADYGMHINNKGDWVYVRDGVELRDVPKELEEYLEKIRAEHIYDDDEDLSLIHI